MQISTTTEERLAIAHCLATYLTNERDKGAEGIGSDLSSMLSEWFDAVWESSEESFDISPLQLAHVQKALDMCQEHEDVDQATVAGLLGRIEKAYPSIIPAAV